MTIKHSYPPIRLRELRVAANIGPKALADAAGVRAWVIYQIEFGQCNPLLHRSELKKVAKVLGTTLVEVMRPATQERPVTAAKTPPNLPATIPRGGMVKRKVEDAPRRGRPPALPVQGDVVHISLAVGGVPLGGIETRDLPAIRKVLRDLFGGDDDAG